MMVSTACSFAAGSCALSDIHVSNSPKAILENYGHEYGLCQGERERRGQTHMS